MIFQQSFCWITNGNLKFFFACKKQKQKQNDTHLLNNIVNSLWLYFVDAQLDKIYPRNKINPGVCVTQKKHRHSFLNDGAFSSAKQQLISCRDARLFLIVSS